MLVIGLTGGIATGKSTVSSLLQSSYNIPIIDADILARRVVEPGTSALKAISLAFGSGVLQPDGTLDRKKLGDLIFNDEAKRKALNRIVHPAVRRAMVWEIVKCWFAGERYCVVDVPLLVETGLWKWVGCVVVVSCAEQTQLERLMERDSFSSESSARSRLSSQMPISTKTSYADIVIDNGGTLAELEEQVRVFVRRLDRHGWSWWWSWRISWLIPPLGLLSAALLVLWRRTKYKLKKS